MEYGIKPHKPDHRSFDYLKTHVFGAVGVPELPTTVDNDAHLWMPNQNAPEPIFNNPAWPYGCTDYGQTKLAINHDKKLYNPARLEAVTHANALGGYDMRKSFQAMIDGGMENKDGTITPCPFKQYFEVRAQGTLDWFDAFRTALFLGIGDSKTISTGQPWYQVYEQIGADGILPDVMDYTKISGWHDAVVVGYTDTNTSGQKIRGGELFLKIDSDQGVEYGDKGYCYMDRIHTNLVFNTYGTIALIGSPVYVANVFTIDLSWVQTVLSFVRMINNNYIMRPLGFT